MAKRDALAKYDQEMAQAAEAAAKQEAGVGGGSFFSFKNGLHFAGARLPKDEVACVVLDGILENAYFSRGFDPDSPEPPSCYAFGRDDQEMRPHEQAAEPQSETCATCPHNEWGSGTRTDGTPGRGKACKNRRRLALIPAGSLTRDGFEPPSTEDLASAERGYMEVPPTSIGAYAGWVKQVRAALRRPPHGVYARITRVDDDKTIFKVTFETLAEVPAEAWPVLRDRAIAEAEAIDFPYPKAEPARAARRAPARQAPQQRRARKF